ncbi:hypothetical protein BDF20DRAFT_398569 [Mycotypha africana]|uniref:uncharacterized protein n=1 Tax=Mycotypha africana TaxID=64632 RepID=UPI002301F9C4|nr:uncharacterized protein BDF20DRAFT_398569 [Mycotypha africana]KAI8984602.1 hypothetical protein BDF20DRAFT_398569 [Mycotypha africana]
MLPALFCWLAKCKLNQVEDVSQWTQDQVQSYLDKYNIAYEGEESPLETVKRYRDTALANANFFMSDRQSAVARIVQGLRVKLEKNYKLSQANIDSLSSDLTHELTQLSLRGQLTSDMVKQRLDKYKAKAIKQKYVTDAQWKGISNDVQEAFMGSHPAWYQKLLGLLPTTSSQFGDNTFHTWVNDRVAKRLQENKELTKDQINAIVNTLQKALSSSTSSAQDMAKLGTAEWWKQVSNDITKQANIKQDQAANVMGSLKDEVNAYKIFAMDYATQASDHANNMLAAATQYLKNAGNQLYEQIAHPLKAHPEKERQVNDALYTASSAAASATGAAGASASSLHAKATDAAASATGAAAASASSFHAKATDAAASMANAAAQSASSITSHMGQTASNTKDTLGAYWRQKELETYKKVGYTQAHIDWIENYLSKAFADKTHIAKTSVQDTLRAIRDYLVATKVQTAAHIDAQLKSLEAVIEHWRRTTVRDEL